MAQKNRKSLVREYTESILVAVVIAVLIRAFVISAYRIPTGSMAPTLKVGDFIFAYRLPFGLELPFLHHKIGMRPPERGDVVVFRYPGNESMSYVKRIVGLAGDRILIKQKQLFVNSEAATYEPLQNTLIRDQPGHDYYQVLKEKLGQAERTVMISKAAETHVFGPEIVPEGKVFVLGDNRDSSDDSRYWGVVPVENIQGRVFLVWLSLDWFNGYQSGRLPKVRWERVFSSVR